MLTVTRQWSRSGNLTNVSHHIHQTDRCYLLDELLFDPLYSEASIDILPRVW